MKRILGLHGGYGGFGTEVRAWFLKENRADAADNFDEIYLIDDFLDKIPPEMQQKHAVISREAFLEKSSDAALFFNVLIGDSAARKSIWEFYTKENIPPATLSASTADINMPLSKTNGGVFSQNTIITSDITIGIGCHLNIYTYIAHDCVIGNFVTFAPRASCNGHVVIKDGAYIGTGAIIRNGSKGKPLIIGKNAVIGMGAVVTKDVPDGVTVVGNPAKAIQR